MKKSSVLQLIIIGFGLLAGYTFLNMVPTLLYYLFMWFDGGASGGIYMETLIMTILSLALYLIMCLYGIKYSKPFAEKISDKTGADLHLPANMDMKYILYIVLFAIGLFGIIDKLPAFLINIYNYFKARNSMAETEMINPQNGAPLVMQGISLLLCFILVIYAHVFADMLDKRIDKAESPTIGEPAD